MVALMQGVVYTLATNDKNHFWGVADYSYNNETPI